MEHVDVEEKCEEGLPEEDCLLRRTLIAHTDYIYTQKQNPWLIFRFSCGYESMIVVYTDSNEGSLIINLNVCLM